MDPEVARIMLAVITAAGAVAWLAGLRFLLASSRVRRTGGDHSSAEVSLAGGRPEGWLAGSAEVEGQASALASRAAAVLAQGSPSAFGPVMIVEKADDHVRFERAGVGVSNQPAGQCFRRGELRFTPLAPGRTRVEWAVEPADLRWLLWLGGLFQAAGRNRDRAKNSGVASKYSNRRRRLILSGSWPVPSAVVMDHSSRRLSACSRSCAGSPCAT
jgi:hypothetical protein